MPRLIGKSSNTNLYTGMLIVFAIAAVGSLEYFGVVNVIPSFGKDYGVRSVGSLEYFGVVHEIPGFDKDYGVRSQY